MRSRVEFKLHKAQKAFNSMSMETDSLEKFLRKDIEALKDIVASLSERIHGLENDVEALEEDVRILKNDSVGAHYEVSDVVSRVDRMESGRE